MSSRYVAEAQKTTYEDFMRDQSPLDLLGEIAAQRALVVELREAWAADGADKVAQFFQDVQSGFETMVNLWAYRYPGFPEEIIEEAKSSLLNIVQGAHSIYFPVQTRITSKDAEVMSKLFKNIVDSAEKYKKIFESITIGLDTDGGTDTMMQHFIVNVILPNISVQDRMKVGKACVEYFSSPPSQRALVTARVVEG